MRVQSKVSTALGFRLKLSRLQWPNLRKPVLYPAELRDRALHKWMMRRALATTFLARVATVGARYAGGHLLLLA